MIPTIFTYHYYYLPIIIIILPIIIIILPIIIII